MYIVIGRDQLKKALSAVVTDVDLREAIQVADTDHDQECFAVLAGLGVASDRDIETFVYSGFITPPILPLQQKQVRRRSTAGVVVPATTSTPVVVTPAEPERAVTKPVLYFEEVPEMYRLPRHSRRERCPRLCTAAPFHPQVLTGEPSDGGIQFSKNIACSLLVLPDFGGGLFARCMHCVSQVDWDSGIKLCQSHRRSLRLHGKVTFKQAIEWLRVAHRLDDSAGSAFLR